MAYIYICIHLKARWKERQKQTHRERCSNCWFTPHFAQQLKLDQVKGRSLKFSPDPSYVWQGAKHLIRHQ